MPSTKAITTFYFSYWCSNSYKSISTSGANKNCNLLQQKLTQVNYLERENKNLSSLGVIMTGVISALEENNSTTILGPDNLLRVFNFQKQANSMANDAQTNCRITDFFDKAQRLQTFSITGNNATVRAYRKWNLSKDYQCNYNQIPFCP